MSRAQPEPSSFCIAILAMGGQGGGVLVDWIVELAEHAGWTAQATSVAGVAQRTGATLYYLELIAPTPGRVPVMALMPVPGEVDIVIAAELMEAGRAVERGLVTPDRTLLLASSHRAYAVLEKIAPGNGLADSAAVAELLRGAARSLVLADMNALALAQGSVISASLFGALAGSGALPFEQAAFEGVVQRSGLGVKASLAALRAAADVARAQRANAATLPTLARAEEAMLTAPRALPERAASAALQPLLDRVRRQFPAPAWPWLGEGLARVVDWQDAAYGAEYLDEVAPFARLDDGREGHALSIEAARWIAVAMSYDDVIRVADLKTRAERHARIRGEVGAAADAVVSTEEYFHPRLEEAMSLMPRRLADALDGLPAFKQWLAPRLDRGRRIQSHTLRGHLQLRALAALRRWRRGSRRHAEELAHRRAWLALAQELAATDLPLATEVLRCRRLIKGYSDTHARGSQRFERLMDAARRLRSQPQAAQHLAQLRAAALRDAEGRALEAQWSAVVPPDAASRHPTPTPLRT